MQPTFRRNIASIFRVEENFSKDQQVSRWQAEFWRRYVPPKHRENLKSYNLTFYNGQMNCSLYVQCFIEWQGFHWADSCTNALLSGMLMGNLGGCVACTLLVSQYIFGIWECYVPEGTSADIVNSFEVSLSLNDWTKIQVQLQDPLSLNIFPLPNLSKSYKSPL
jgi:hypothetical protein